MLISVIIPVYNVAPYLERCVESVLSQNYENIEVLLIDDGSTDGSPFICDEYAKKDKRVRVIHQPNSGLAGARNTGIEDSKGSYILFLDGDDFFIRDFLSDIAGIAQKSMPDVIIGNGCYLYFNERKIKEKSYGYDEDEMKGYEGRDILKYLYTKTKLNPFSCCVNAYKRDFIVNNNLFFEEKILFSEDSDWVTRVFLKVGSFEFYPRLFYAYRVNRPGSIMYGISFKKVETFLCVVNKWIEKSSGIDDEELASTVRSKFCDNFCDYLKYVYGFKKSDRNVIIEKIKKSLFLNYVSSKKYKIKNNIEKFGYNYVLFYLFLKYRLRKVIKMMLVKTGFLK